LFLWNKGKPVMYPQACFSLSLLLIF
jgi:hypothetical protein